MGFSLYSLADCAVLNEIRKLEDTGVLVDHVDSAGVTALSCAAENGLAEVVALPLKAGVNVEAQNKHGWTPINWAAVKGHAEAVELL